MSEATARRGGFTVLVWVYVVLTLAALGRSGYQLATKYDEAPLAYLLSAFAAVVYLVATIALMTHVQRGSRAVALVALSVEAIGVLAVGTLSLLRPELFPADTVWSAYGRGYMFIPLVLPFVGLWWLRGRTRQEVVR